MPGVHGALPVTIQLTDTVLQLTQNLKPGQNYRSVVTETSQGQFVSVAGSRITLPQSSTLMPGQSVTIEIQTSLGKPQIVIQSVMTSAASTTSVPASASILAQIIKQLPGLLSLSPEQSTPLVPASLPSTETIVRIALQVFQLHANTSKAVSTVIRALKLTSSKGSGGSTIEYLLLLLGDDLNLQKAESIAPFLKRLQKQSQRAPLSHLLAPFAPAGDSNLYVLLAAIRNDESIRVVLGSEKSFEGFQRAVEMLMDNVAGRHLQNTRSQEFPYVYLNIPLSDESLTQAQIHIFGDGKAPGEDGEGESAQIVLDVQTSKLGDIWIHVQHSNDRCTCRFDVATEEIADYLNKASSELEAILQGSAFKKAEVMATVSDGDRMSRIAKLFQPYTGLNVTI